MIIQNLINHIKISENFILEEFQCPCCQKVMLHRSLLQRLQELRTKIGKPVIITSGYRCPDYNQIVGGVEDSYHLFGMAADVYSSGIPLTKLLKAAEEIGFFGIGFYPKNNFLHLDIRPASPTRWQG